MVRMLAAGGPWLIPEGPLHPSLAIAGLVVGVSAAVVAGPGLRRWLALVMGGALLLISATIEAAPSSGLIDHGEQTLVLVTTAAVVGAAALARMSRSTATWGALGGCAGVWAVVPDTEVALLCGAVLLGAGSVGAIPGWLPDRHRAAHSVLLILPLAGAAWGSIGRPDRYAPALVVGTLALVLGLLVRAVTLSARAFSSRAFSSRALSARGDQRAGTPTTVESGATSSTTTAPAPTTAF